MGATTIPEPYWVLVDESSVTRTFEHKLPHGMLVRVYTRVGYESRAISCAESIVFVPNPPAMEPYR